jgi:hypothetical protein
MERFGSIVGGVGAQRNNSNDSGYFGSIGSY